MKKLTVFYLVGCPYCNSAKRAAAQLQAEHPEYANIEIDWKDEDQIKQFPEWCDYYYVPTIYLGEQKLYEAHPGDSDAIVMEHVKNAFEAALKSE